MYTPHTYTLDTPFILRVVYDDLHKMKTIGKTSFSLLLIISLISSTFTCATALHVHVVGAETSNESESKSKSDQVGEKTVINSSKLKRTAVQIYSNDVKSKSFNSNCLYIQPPQDDRSDVLGEHLRVGPRDLDCYSALSYFGIDAQGKIHLAADEFEYEYDTQWKCLAAAPKQKKIVVKECDDDETQTEMMMWAHSSTDGRISIRSSPFASKSSMATPERKGNKVALDLFDGAKAGHSWTVTTGDDNDAVYPSLAHIIGYPIRFKSAIDTSQGKESCLLVKNMSNDGIDVGDGIGIGHDADVYVGAHVYVAGCDLDEPSLWKMDEEGKIHLLVDRNRDENEAVENKALNIENDLCLEATPKRKVQLQTCKAGRKKQRWMHNALDQTLMSGVNGMLNLSLRKNEVPHRKGTKVVLKKKKRDENMGHVWSMLLQPSVTVPKTEYSSGEPIEVSFSNDKPSPNSWLAIYPAGLDPDALPSPSTMWTWVKNLDSGLYEFSDTSDHGNSDWPLCDGEWRLFLLNDINAPYASSAASEVFTVSGGDCYGPCEPATTQRSNLTHRVPQDGEVVSNVAFSSCYAPGRQNSDVLWNHVRHTFQADVWSWLGDNAYSDGSDMEYKRNKYNEGKENEFYASSGPIGEPKIPVTGTWDDHDFGANNMGKEYQCLKPSQDEFSYFFDLPENDPRHPSQGTKQRNGIYHAYMFAEPGSNDKKNNDGGTSENGIHLIHLDARSHRSPTFNTYGDCEGKDSSMLGEEQWTWLQMELNRPSKVKIIGSGIQVLPPTYHGRPLTEYCSFDGEEGTFLQANSAVGEDEKWQGTRYECWSEIPQERTRLLQMVQKSINDGNSKKVIFISGDQHWGEIMAKEMPPHPSYGDAQILYEVTGSGIDQNWLTTVLNSNRVRVRSADTKGDGFFHNECNFPFIYHGMEYNNCTRVDATEPWCSIDTDDDDNHVTGSWGYCLDESKELVSRSEMSYSNEHSCSNNYFHVCSARANYGGVAVDWESRTISLTTITPHESEPVAASITIHL